MQTLESEINFLYMLINIINIKYKYKYNAYSLLKGKIRNRNNV